MRRREFLSKTGSTVFAWPLAARAQQVVRVPIVGVLTPHLLHAEFPAFLEKLGELGYEDGQNVRLIVRSAESKLERLPELAAELVQMKVDVIVAINTPGTRAAVNATKEISIVMGIVGDPIADGFVSNLARPGGNVTGISNMGGELAAKRLQIFKEVLPASRRIAVMFNSDDPVTGPQIKETARGAKGLAIEIRFFPVVSEATLNSSFKDLTDWRADGVLWLSGQAAPFMSGTIELAGKHRLPTMVLFRHEVQAGGLISYYPDHRQLFRRVAAYVDKILKGAKPADLPIEQPTKFELIVNLKTAKAISLEIPRSLIAHADEVIE
jgi:putative tryptophan/tyrosine transport system substrate-binding protein